LALSRFMISGMGSIFSVAQLGRGSTSGIITDDSETLWLDNLEFELVGRTRRTADRDGVRMDRVSNL